jgi:hypothetical protein
LLLVALVAGSLADNNEQWLIAALRLTGCCELLKLEHWRVSNKSKGRSV